MTTDTHEHRGGGSFPVDRPIEALKADHHLVKQLFDRYLNTQDADIRKEAGPRALMLVEMHTALEEAVFYPQVREADATLVERCEDEHEQAKDMIAQLKRMNEDDPQFDEMFRQLVDSVTRHIDTEEHELFPRVEQANLDLNAIGRQMQAFEASMLGTRQRGSSQPGIQQ